MLDRLLVKVRERLNLKCYTKWEHEFLVSALKQYDRRGRLSERQVVKVREIVLQRYVKGEAPYIKQGR